MTAFRKSLNDLKGTEILASVYCPIAARMADDLGFKFGMVGGSVASMAMLATPDLMLLTSTELCDMVKRTSQTSKLKIVVDGDAGYGNALNTMRTVTELEMSGASAVTLEDTKLPVSYGQRKTELISVEEQIDKISAALDARSTDKFGIIARTQVVEDETDEQAGERVARYAESGASAICLAGVTKTEQLRALTKDSDLPVMLITYGKANDFTDEILAECQVKLLLTGHTPFEHSLVAAYQALAALSRQSVPKSMLAYNEIMERYTVQKQFDEAIHKYLKIEE